MLRVILLSRATLFIVYLGAATATAQESELLEAEESAESEESEEPIESQEVLITAPRPQTASSDQVLRDEDFRYYPKRSASDLLRLVPGLWLTQHTGGAKAHQIFLRGFDAEHGQDLLVELDGIPLNETSHVHGQGYLDLHFLIPEVIQRIRLIKGPYDAEYGNFATAGAIQFETANEREYTAQAKVTAGQFNSLGLFGELAVGNAHRGVLLALEKDDTDGFTDPGRLAAQRLFAKANTDLGLGWSLSALVAGYRARSQAADTLPLDWIQAGKIDRFSSLDDSNRVDVDRWLGGLSLQGPLWRGRLQTTAWTNVKDTTIFSNYTYYYFEPTRGDQLEQSDDRTSGGLRLKHTRLIEWNELSQISKLGLDWRIDDVSELQARCQHAERFNLLNQYDFTEQLFSFWTQQEFIFSERFRIITGLRYDLQHVKSTGTQDLKTLDIQTNRQVVLEDESRQANEFAHAISPKLSAVFSPSEQVQLFANLGRGFVTRPAREQTNEPEAMAVAVHGAELGLGWSSPQRRFRVTSSLWWLHKAEEHIFDPETGTSANRGVSHRVGIELEGRWAISSWAWLALDLFWLKPMLYSQDKWQPLPNAPDLMASHMLGIKHPSGITFSLRGRFLGPRHHDLGLKSDAVYLVDLTLGYSTKRISLGFEIENLLNSTWEDSVFAYPVRPTPTAEIDRGLQVTPGSPFYARFYLSARY